MFGRAPSKRIRKRVIVTVRCSGKLHRVRLDSNGPISFLDHPVEDMRASQTLTEMGGEPNRCLELLQAWRRMREIDQPTAFATGRRRHRVNDGRGVEVEKAIPKEGLRVLGYAVMCRRKENTVTKPTDLRVRLLFRIETEYHKNSGLYVWGIKHPDPDEVNVFKPSTRYLSLVVRGWAKVDDIPTIDYVGETPSADDPNPLVYAIREITKGDGHPGGGIWIASLQLQPNGKRHVIWKEEFMGH